MNTEQATLTVSGSTLTVEVPALGVVDVIEGEREAVFAKWRQEAKESGLGVYFPLDPEANAKPRGEEAAEGDPPRVDIFGAMKGVFSGPEADVYFGDRTGGTDAMDAEIRECFHKAHAEALASGKGGIAAEEAGWRAVYELGTGPALFTKGQP